MKCVATRNQRQLLFRDLCPESRSGKLAHARFKHKGLYISIEVFISLYFTHFFDFFVLQYMFQTVR